MVILKNKNKKLFCGIFGEKEVFSAGKLSHHSRRYIRLKNIPPFGQRFEEFPQNKMGLLGFIFLASVILF